MERWVGRLALVTGASSGIGAAISKTLVEHGMNVVGCARRLDRLQDLNKECESQHGKFYPIKCDITQEGEVLAMFGRIKQDYGGVDVCINNAGVLITAPLLSGETKDWQTMVDVNVIGACVCTREAVKSMKEKGVDDGQIININSLSGHRTTGGKDSNFYAATKFALRAITEGARCELRERKSNIRIAEISPGLVETELWSKAYKDKPSTVKKIMDPLTPLTAEDIASSVEYILSAPPHVQVNDILLRPTLQRS